MLTSQRAIRWSHYKYVFNSGDLEELYDLAADPHELCNLAVDPASADLLGAGRKKLSHWMEQKGDSLGKQFNRIFKNQGITLN